MGNSQAASTATTDAESHREGNEAQRHHSNSSVHTPTGESKVYLNAVSRLLSTSVSRHATTEWSRLWEWPKVCMHTNLSVLIVFGVVLFNDK